MITMAHNNVAGGAAYCDGEVEVDMMVIYRNRRTARGVTLDACPIRVGRILRIVQETAAPPFIIMESWWPVLKPDKYGKQVNLFGTWIASKAPRQQDPPKAKRPATGPLEDTLMVNLADVLVWPVTMVPGSEDVSDGFRIPFSVFHFLRDHKRVDLAATSFTFARRGLAFYTGVVKDIGRRAYEENKKH
jgi:hypothetical protein